MEAFLRVLPVPLRNDWLSSTLGHAEEGVMPDQLSSHYRDLPEGSYDCVDRIVLNAYFGFC